MEALWSELNERLSWPMLNRILRRRRLPTAQGKYKTFEKISASYDSNDEVRTNFNLLEEDLCQAIYYRDKYIKFFDYPAAIINSMINFIETEFQNFDYTRLPIGTYFPLRDDEDSIMQQRLNAPELIRVVRNERGYYLVYSTIRQLRIRENLDERFEGIDGVDFVNDYNVVYGERIISIQCFDIINIDSRRNIVELRIDNSLDLTVKQLERNYSEILEKAQALFMTVTGANLVGRGHNFYSMLRRLYDDGDQGKVKEMAFITDTNTLKHEKELYTSDIDLRTDPYHRRGRAGIAMDFYRLGVNWNVSEPCLNSISLAVLGKHYVLNYRGGAYLDAAFIRDCHVASEYYFLFDIIQTYA